MCSHSMVVACAPNFCHFGFGRGGGGGDIWKCPNGTNSDRPCKAVQCRQRAHSITRHQRITRHAGARAQGIKQGRQAAKRISGTCVSVMASRVGGEEVVVERRKKPTWLGALIPQRKGRNGHAARLACPIRKASQGAGKEGIKGGEEGRGRNG